jgi:hypothetical protein
VAAWIYATTGVTAASWQPTPFALGGGTVATQALAVTLSQSNLLTMSLATAGTSSPGAFATGGTLSVGNQARDPGPTLAER